MRGAGVVSFVLLLLGWQAAAFGQNGPPPPQSFGADSERTYIFTGTGTTGLDCQGSTDAGWQCTGFLPSFDRTLLDVRLAVPAGSGPHPLVAVQHGRGGSNRSFSYSAYSPLADGRPV